jgi:arylsulfatase
VVRRVWRACLVAGLVALAGCSAPAPDASRPDIVLIVVDTLRADHLGVYGYTPPTSPRIDALASGATVFDAAWGAAPWTLPSVMSIFTGRYPSSHRVENDGLRLAADVPTLPQILKARGYATGGFVSHVYVTSPYGFERGFDRFDDFGLSRPGYRLEARLEPPADKVTDSALRWLKTQRGKPVFLFVHYFDVHWPYEPPDTTRDLFPSSYRGPLDATWDSLSKFQDPSRPMPEDYRRFLVSRYDGEIRFVDQQIGLLLDGLQLEQRAGRAWVVLTADHGEEFKEHGSIGHGRQLYEEVVHVPLVVAGPAGVGPAQTGTAKAPAGTPPSTRRIALPVSGVDLLPTILDLAGGKAGAGAPAGDVPAGLDGRSFAAILRGAKADVAADRPVLSETVRLNAYRRAVRVGALKLIDTMDESRSELFDLAADPKETQDLSPARRDDRLRLTRLLFARPDLLAGGWNLRWKSGGQKDRPGAHRFEGTIRTSGIFRSVVPLFRDGGAYRLAAPDRLEFADPGESGEGGLVFTTAPESATVTFDLRIDGQAAVGAPGPGETLLGARVQRPQAMPFTIGDRGADESAFAPPPEGACRTPCLLLWRTHPASADESVTLDPDTRERLRSLGYID